MASGSDDASKQPPIFADPGPPEDEAAELKAAIEAKKVTLPDVDLDAKAILAAEDRRMERVPAPEWGGWVWARNLTGTQRDQIEASTAGAPGGPDLRNFRAKVVAAGACNKEGKSLFTFQQAKELGEKDSGPIDRVASAILRLSRWSKKDQAELLGNLETGPSGASATA